MDIDRQFRPDNDQPHPFEVAERAMREGIRLAGTVQPVGPDMPQQKCEIVLNLLPTARSATSAWTSAPAFSCRLTQALEGGDRGGITCPGRRRWSSASSASRRPRAGLVEAIGRRNAGLPVLVGVSPNGASVPVLRRRHGTAA